MGSASVVSARNAVATSLSRPWYAATIARLGYTAKQIAAVSDDLVDAIVAHGDPDSIASMVAAHQAAGADHVILMPSGTADLDLMAGVAQLEHLAPAVLQPSITTVRPTGSAGNQ